MGFLAGSIPLLKLGLLHLKACVNKECPELKLGLGSDSIKCTKTFGVCRSGMKGISDQTMLKFYETRINTCINKFSGFDLNLQRAVRTALQSTELVQSQPLSLSGYLFDFEVLLDGNGDPIPIPVQWKHRNPQILCASVGASRPTRVQIKFSDELVKSMRDVEESSENVGDSDVLVSTPIVRHLGAIQNLASDWGSKFGEPSRRPVRKLLIEGDGPFHYASNYSSHILGVTVMKRRLTEALGWELLSVSSVLHTFPISYCM